MVMMLVYAICCNSFRHILAMRVQQYHICEHAVDKGHPIKTIIPLNGDQSIFLTSIPKHVVVRVR